MVERFILLMSLMLAGYATLNIVMPPLNFMRGIGEIAGWVLKQTN